MRVLLVEDDVTTAKNIEMMCHKAGYVCDTTGLGEQAVELGTRNEYDIVVLDIMLPDIDGYQVKGRLRAAGVKTPFLIQSGLVDRDNKSGGRVLGVGDDYLAKPFTRSEFIERVQTVIWGSKQTMIPHPEYESNHQEPPRENQTERREHRRFNTAKTAQIIYKDCESPINCIVFNMSQGGAAIQLPDVNCHCPPSFILKLRSGGHLHCNVCWRSRDRIGVKFIPAHH